MLRCWISRRHPRSLALSALFTIISWSAASQSLEQTLLGAYESNAALEVARQELRVVNELAPQARAGYRPSLSGFVRLGAAYEFTDDDGEAANGTSAAGVTLTQPLYRGGRTLAGISSAENTVFAQREIYRSVEQDVLLKAAIAHLDVRRDEAIVDLSRRSQEVVAEQVSVFRHQFDVSAATRTDVAQGDVRLARSAAGLARAEADLAISRASYVEIVGRSPETLEPTDAEAFPLPSDQESLIAEAFDRNPIVRAALYAKAASQDDIDVANGWSRPEVDAVGSVQYFSESADGDAVNLDDEFAVGRVELRVTIPLYEGTYGSRKRQSSRVADQRRAELTAARQRVEQEALGAWASWQAARLQVDRLAEAVAAAEQALDGLRKEHKLGERTALDLLNGEQEWLDTSIEFVRARRDLVVSRLQISVALGAFTADGLALDTELYDIESDFQEVRDNWF